MLRELIYRIVHPDDMATLMTLSTDPDRMREPASLRWIKPDGSIVWTVRRLVPEVDEDGSLVAFDGIAYDVTARRNAEEARLSSERRFRSLVENAADLVGIFDTDGTIRFATPSIETLFGYTVDAVLGHNVLNAIHPEDRDRIAALLADPPNPPRPIDFRMADTAGTWRWIEAVGTDQRDNPDVGGVVINARDVTDRRALLDELERRANFDPLTGLSNRYRFEARLTAALASPPAEGTLVVAAIAVDRLGDVNETFGYTCGDEVLREAGRRLRVAGGPASHIARIDGNNFAVLAHLGAGAEPEVWVEGMLRPFDSAFIVNDQPLHVDATLGLKVVEPGRGDADAMLRRAEQARNAASRQGRHWMRWDTGLEVPVAHHLSLLGQLRQAMAAGQLELHYQPKVQAVGGGLRVIGVEALLRWHHPDHGWVSPESYLPLAERTGLIHPLTAWVVETAACQQRTWAEAGLDLTVAVNVTARNLQHDDFVAEMAARLERVGVPHGSLYMELTERSVMTDPDAATIACDKLRALGVRLSLDDFGTGQSALAHLSTLPIDEVKIDKSFVQGMATERGEAIVTAIIGMAQALGKRLVAEGVEDAATSDRLIELGCDVIQGYHFSRPVPAADIPAAIARIQAGG